MNHFSFDFNRTADSLFKALGQDEGRAQVNIAAPIFTYLGTRFVTALVFTIDPLHALAYELTASAVDLAVGPIFADTHNKPLRELVTALIPFSAALILGCNPLFALGLMITSAVSRALVHAYDDDNKGRYTSEPFPRRFAMPRTSNNRLYACAAEAAYVPSDEDEEGLPGDAARASFGPWSEDEGSDGRY